MGFEVHVHCCEGQKSHEQLGGMSSDVLILSARENATNVSGKSSFFGSAFPVTFMLASAQKYLNDIIASWPSALEIKQDTNNSIIAIIATDINGDIGITSDNCELTVFGLGSHAHYYSPTNEIDEICTFIPVISIFIDDLIHCRVAAFSVYYDTFCNGLEPACGGFGKWENEILYISYLPKKNDRIIIRLHGNSELTLSHTQVAPAAPG